MVELFFAPHFFGPLPEESVLGDGVRVIDGRRLQKACSEQNDLFARCRLISSLAQVSVAAR